HRRQELVMKYLIIAAVACLGSIGPLLPDTAAATTETKSAARTQAPDTTEFDKQLAKVQEQMKTMQAEMDKIRQTHDPQERQRLLQQHWSTMQSAMSAMHGLWGPGKMGGPGMMGSAGMMGGWGHMGGYYANLTPEQLRRRQYMTDQYLNMQQQMMNN